MLENRSLQIVQFGAPDADSTIKLTRGPVPECPPDAVVVRMQYACINPSDMFTAQGIYPGAKACRTGELPARIGFEGSGTIYKVGSAVKNPMLQPGAKVTTFHGRRERFRVG